MGIIKVNIGTDVFEAYMKSTGKVIQEKDKGSARPISLFSAIHDSLKEIMINYIRKLDANGKGHDLMRTL